MHLLKNVLYLPIYWLDYNFFTLPLLKFLYYMILVYSSPKDSFFLPTQCILISQNCHLYLETHLKIKLYEQVTILSVFFLNLRPKKKLKITFASSDLGIKYHLKLPKIYSQNYPSLEVLNWKKQYIIRP